MNFVTLAHERYSCRKFSGAPVKEEAIERILEAGTAAPTAVNKQPYKIWVMTSEDARRKIGEVTRYTFGANVFVVIGSRREEAWVRPSDGKNFGEVDAAIVATHIMLAIHDEGLGTTWVGHFDAPRLQEYYPDMKDYALIALFPVGHPAEDAAPGSSHSAKKDREHVVAWL